MKSSFYDDINLCIISEQKSADSHFRIDITLKGWNQNAFIAATVDCSATALFINKKFIKQNRIRTHPLTCEIPLYNIDRSKNCAGGITHFARLQLRIGGSTESQEFLITELGPKDVVLGLFWLKSINPKIDWKEGTMEIDPETRDNEWPSLEQNAANRVQQRRWWKDKILEDPLERLWCVAGYTYLTKLAEKAGKHKPKRSMVEMIPLEYRQYAKVFSKVVSERLPEHKPYNHLIDLKLETPETIRSKIYPMPMNEQQELNWFLEDSLRKGYIVPSKSLIASPIFFIKKNDGWLCLMQDYHRLNDFMIKNCYLLPLASDIINRLCQAQLFTKFNIWWGYNNIHIKAGDERKAAFTTNGGLFEPQVMFFSLTNSPATFQALMNTIFVDLVAAGKVVIYLGNILIYSMTPQEHRTTTQEVLQWLADHDLYLWPEKCEFNQPCIEYLGLIIRQGEVSMDLIKVQAITTWPAPRTLRKLRGFLGFANFYCQFIKNFAKIARPLNNLTRKDTSWHWDTTQHQAFQTLKCAFSRHPILAMWDPNWPTRLEVDAFSYATGGVLLQWLDNDLWHPIAYRSQSRADAECNYEIYDKEMLTIIRALKDWQHYLEGLPQSFTIITDHQNLQFWHTTQNLTHCQAQWSLYLSHFNFLLTHKPSSSNTQADPLFRISTHTISDADNNKH